MKCADGWWFRADAEINVSVPLSVFILKVASRCNLKCPDCYVYRHADQGWRGQPTFMSMETLNTVSRRISEYLAQRHIESVSIVLHGGEPLLLGVSGLEQTLETLRREITSSVNIEFGLQTNGTLIDQDFIRVLRSHEVRTGISIDGQPRDHDRRRVYADDRGSSQDAIRAARLLAVYPEIFGGVLCVIDLNSDPLETYRYLRSLRPPRIDFLLPDGNHEHSPSPDTLSLLGYADWLIAIYNEWYQDTRAPSVRLFESIIRILLGGESLIDSVGINVDNLVTIQTNGDIEGNDTLKICYSGAAETGLCVFENSIAEAEASPPLLARRLGLGALCDKCLACNFLLTCGGGYISHRFSSSGFVNPTIYCNVMKKVISRIALSVAEGLNAAGETIPISISKLTKNASL